MLSKKLDKIYAYHGWRQRIKLTESEYTPGNIDNDIWSYLGLPESIKDQSFLDIGSNDGQVAFEAEKRGAKEICASDLYLDNLLSMKFGWPIEGIQILREYFNSKIEIHKGGVYELSDLDIKFDHILVNNVIVWLEDLDSAINNISKVSKGKLYIADAFLMPNSKESKRESKDKDGFRFLYTTEYLKESLKKHGFKVNSIKRLPYNRMVMRRYLERPKIVSNGKINFYTLPDSKSEVKSIDNINTIAASEINGFYFIHGKGWIDKKDVNVTYFKPSLVYQMMKTIGLDSLYFSIRNKMSIREHQALMVIAEKI